MDGPRSSTAHPTTKRKDKIEPAFATLKDFKLKFVNEQKYDI